MNYAHSRSPDEVWLDHNIGRSYFGTNEQPLLSVKCMFNGRARYVVGERRSFVIDDSCYVVLNHGNPYSIEKRSLTPVETFCVFFPEHIASQAERDVTLPAGILLNGPEPSTGGGCGFLEHCRPHGDAVSQHLMRMRQAVLSGNRITDAWLEEQTLLLLVRMLESESGVQRAIARLPRARRSTRQEMFRRVHLGRDYLHANLDRAVSLADAASAAAMSRYHFLRSFAQVFGTTPREYLATERLRRAAQLLRRTQLSVTEIVAQVGLVSLPSFVNLFHRTFGMSPTCYRRSQSRNRR
jgi:AraC family transcriptional regulator